MFHARGPTFFELARQALSSTERGYDLLAPKFDFTPFRTPDDVLAQVALELRPLGPFASALDLCCGTGAGVRALRPLCTERVVGIDFSAGMLDEARRQLEPAADGAQVEVELVRGDVLELEYEREFDLVTCFGALGHIPRHDEMEFLRRIGRALKPGGVFAFITARMPRPLSPAWLFSRGYNALAHLRNLLVHPPFVMFYLTFTLDEVRPRLEQLGFEAEVRERLFEGAWRRGVLVMARKRED
jgi:ubiquinone/menaquinone biosynthesis C-methylase UbiE